MARSSRSTTTGGPTSACSRPSSATRTATGLVYQVVRPAVPRWSVAARRPARGPQAPAQERAQGPPAGPLRVARRAARGRRSSTAAKKHRGRGHGRQAPAVPYEPGRRTRGMAQDQDPARAGARGRWLDPGEWQRQGPRGARDRRLRGRQAAVRGQGRERLHRRDPARAAGAAQAARPGRPAVRPAAARRTTGVDGAATFTTSPGSGPSS